MRTLLLAGFCALLGAGSAHAVRIADPGNPADPATGSLYGAVNHTYDIGKSEVTNAQYTEFLNAKAASDPLALYSAAMAGGFGGITQSGVSGSFTYATVGGRANNPVNFVSWFDAIRYANWLHNGKGGGDTETGSYTLLGGTPVPSNGATITRNPGATFVLPSEDEWYKAAYYDAVSSSYNPYPFADGFNGVACEVPAGTTTHSANCDFAVGNTTDVGAYTTSPSAYGTVDQGGNLFEWNEALIGSFRGVRGGNWSNIPGSLAASFRGSLHSNTEAWDIGFRVASVPEPGTGLLLVAGLLGLAGWRTGRA